MKNNWIPVTDRLPDDGEECWTFQPEGTRFARRDYRVALHTYHENYHGDCGQMWVAIDSGNNYPVTYYAADYGFPEEEESEGTVYVTHWQPLERPEAPGASDESNL